MISTVTNDCSEAVHEGGDAAYVNWQQEQEDRNPLACTAAGNEALYSSLTAPF